MVWEKNDGKVAILKIDRYCMKRCMTLGSH